MKFTTICATVMSAAVCALTSSTLAGGGAKAWGWNNAGQTNVPNTANSNVTAITGGYLHTLAIKNSGVLAWGNGSYGQLNVPGAASSGVTKIAAGAYHSLALTGTSLVAWGYNAQGQCNINTANFNISAIAAGSYHSLVLKNGGVFAFGSNGYSQCTIPTTATSGITAIAGGYGHSAALKASAVLAWGDNFYGQRTIPTTATFNITAIACGADHTIALNSSGNVIAWGNNSYGQCLGTNSPGSPITTTANGTAVKINGVTLTGVTAIAGGTDHTVALKNGVALAWGTNTNGQCSIPTSATSGVTAIGAGEYHTVAVGVAIVDPCDVDGNGTPNADEPGATTSTWLFPNITSTFENPANWSAGIPGYNTTAKITGNPQIEFGCDNSVKTLELSTNSTDSSPSMSLNLNGYDLMVYGGRIAFAPGTGSYVPYIVNINFGYIYASTFGNVPTGLRFESDHATWNINNTQLYSYSTEFATIESSQIDVKLNNSTLYTAAISKGDATGGSRHIELLNSSIQDFEGGLTFGDGISLSLGSIPDVGYTQSSIVSYGDSGAVFQPGSILDAWGNLSFVGKASFGGQIDLHTFPSTSHGQSKITVQGQSFNYGAGSSAGDFAFMNVYGNNFNQPTCPPPQCAAEGLITLQLSNGNYNGLASIGGPLFIHNTDGSIPAEGNLYTLISLDPNYQGAFDPNNNKFTSIRWVGQPLPNGLTFEQVLTQNALQLLCKRAAIVEPAPSNTTNLVNIPIAAASADFTSDGRDDVVNLIVGSSNSVQIMKDFGDGTFTQLRTFELPIAEIPNAIAAGNVQDSSMPEIAVTSTVSGVGFVTLYNATGTVIWRRQLNNGERPTCVCTLSPNIANNVPGQVAVGIEKISAFTTESSFTTTSGRLKTMTGTTTTDTPLAGVPRTVRGTDVNGDDFDDATTTGEPSTTPALSQTGGFIQPVTMTANGPQSQSPQWLNYVPVSIAIGDIDHDGIKDIFAACKDIPAAIPASTRPVASFLSGSISPSSGLYTMSSPTGISVGRPVQGKAITLVQRSDGYSLAVASTDGVNDSVDVLEINTFANGGITVGAQTQIATGGGVISLLTLLDTGRQKFATVRNVVSGFAAKDARSSKIASMRGENGFTTNAVIESTGYLEFAYGDINHDGQIDSADLGDMLGQFGMPGNSDLNGDGNTDSADLGVWLGLL